MEEVLAMQGAADQLVAAAREVCETMVALPITEATAWSASEGRGPGGVTGMVGLAGPWSATVSLHCPEPIAMRMTERMLGMPVATVDDDVRDAIGELANMIAGSLKMRLADGNGSCSLSLPTVVTGSDYAVSSLSGCQHSRFRCATPAGEFYLGLAFKGDGRGQP